MPIRGGDMDAGAVVYVNRRKTSWLLAPTVGNIDDFAVHKLDNVYSLWDSDILVGTASVKHLDDTNIVDNVWINPAYQNKKIFTKLLLFFRSRENMEKIEFGTVHSNDTYQILKSGGLKLFKKSWKNNKGEIRSFTIDTIDDFYKGGHWKLVLENSSDFSEFPRFTEGFTMSYDVMLNIFNINEELE